MNPEADIARQKPFERAMAEWLAAETGYELAGMAVGYCPAYDFVLKRKPDNCLRYVEVKCDFMAAKTGNLFFETQNSRTGDPAGLARTESDVWVHYVPEWGRAFVFQPKLMLKVLFETIKPFYQSSVGDGNAAGYIVPAGTVEAQLFVRVFQVPETIKQTLNPKNDNHTSQ